MGKPKIVCLKCIGKQVERCQSTSLSYGLTSGGYDAVHSGHVSSFIDSAAQCTRLIVVVNGDEFLKKKREVVPSDWDEEESWEVGHPHYMEEFIGDEQGYPGKEFMPLKVRCQVIAAMGCVDYVVPFDATDPADLTVCEALKAIKPASFLKGGDRNCDNTPEYKLCQELSIDFIQGMGDDKHWSSSNFLSSWENYAIYTMYAARYDGCLE